jgi:hypothetical protein
MRYRLLCSSVYRLAGLALVLALFGSLATENRCWAQAAEQKLKLLIGDKANDPKPKEIEVLNLRPNLAQEIFVFVQNANNTTEEVIIELRAGGNPVEGGTQKVKVEGNKPQLVTFGKPAPMPADKPLVMTPLTGPLDLRLLGEKNAVLHEVKLETPRPNAYVAVTSIKFDPNEQGGVKNRLIVRLRATEAFAGPPCRVELVLKPDRIPGLVTGQKKEGTYAGQLTAPGDEVVLIAENLKFQSGSDARNGLVYLTIDGYERAYTFTTTFPREGTASEPQRIDLPILQINAPAFAVPSAKFAIGVEVDNSKPDETAEFDLIGVALNQNDELEQKPISLAKFHGDRQITVLFNPMGPKGGLLFKPEFKDWSTELNLSEVFGKRTFRLRLLDKDGNPIKVRSGAEGEPVEKVEKTLVLDASKPEEVKFLDFPKTLVKGLDLPLKARGVDPESGIQEVIFFAGKPTPDGKLPPNPIVAEGKPVDQTRTVWAADLPVSTDQKGMFEVSVRFTNNAGLSATETIRIQLLDPAAAGTADGKGAPAKKETSVEGTVVEGSRSQPNVKVTLRDERGLAKATTTTDAKGKFVFKDIAPGTYRITASKTSSNTRGETTVAVPEGQKKTGVEVKLTR